MVSNGTTNGMRSWTANTPRNVSLLSRHSITSTLLNADLPGVTQEIKTHNMSEVVAISQKTYVTLQGPNASGYDSDNCATSAWSLDRIDSVDISFNNEYEWESDFPDGGVGANVYVFDEGMKVNNGDFGGKAINRCSCLSLCAEVGSCTDNDAHSHGTHVAETLAGHQYGVAKHATIHGMLVIGSDGEGIIIGVLNAMDEVVSSVERQIFQMSIASSASTMWDTTVNTATNDYDAIGPLPWPRGLPAPGYVPKTNPLNGRWVTVTGGDAEFIKKSIASGMLGSAEASKIQAGNYQSDGCSYSPEKLPRRSMSVRTIWTTASLTSAILDRASALVRPGRNTMTGFLHPPTKC